MPTTNEILNIPDTVVSMAKMLAEADEWYVAQLENRGDIDTAYREPCECCHALFVLPQEDRIERTMAISDGILSLTLCPTCDERVSRVYRLVLARQLDNTLIDICDETFTDLECIDPDSWGMDELWAAKELIIAARRHVAKYVAEHEALPA